MGIFDFGRMIFAYNDISNAAREGARKAIVTQNATAITNEAMAATTGLDHIWGVEGERHELRPPVQAWVSH